MTKQPWTPLLTIERSGIPEVTVSGILSIWNGDKPIVSLGDTQALLWGRSLLKPWFLLSLMPLLKTTYPRLATKHLVMMLSSHSGETTHTNTLKEILVMGDLNESMLRCPRALPLSPDRRFQLKTLREKPKPLYHPCSGKHIAALLAAKAHKITVSHYLSKEIPSYQTLRELLGWLLIKSPESFLETTDGCGMPTLALSAEELARLYAKLAHKDFGEYFEPPPPKELRPYAQNVLDLKLLMVRRPILLGGSGRLDTRLVSGDFVVNTDITLVAKEAADGMLAVGIPPLKGCPEGLGILIKLASGHQSKYLELIITTILEQLGLKGASYSEEYQDPMLKTHFHFDVPVRREYRLTR